MMIYLSKTGTSIPFSEESYKEAICDQCVNVYRRSLRGKELKPIDKNTCCCISGCYRKATHTVSFSPDEVVFKESDDGRGRLAEKLAVCDKEDNDEVFVKLEYETMRDYCKSRHYVIDLDDMEEIRRRGLEDTFHGLRDAYLSKQKFQEEVEKE